jgi:hypothetical protein
MTLIVFVRCQDGCILASDRKATEDSGFGDEESKSSVFQCGCAVAGAGDAEPILALFNELEEMDLRTASVGAVCTILETYRTAGTIHVECFILTRGNGTVEATLVETSKYRVTHRSITSPSKCIGANAPKTVATHYLRGRDYSNKKCIEAVPEILAILKQACKKMEFVGEQEDYGFDIILFRPADYVYRTRITTEWAVLTTEIRHIDGRPPQFTFRQFDGGAP